MPSSVRQVSFLACFLLVALRVSIGWQFLYEGVWKLNTQSTSKPWTAEGYLANARGPFRERFRAMVDDPDGLQKLDFATMVSRWDDWKSRFLAHYPSLTEDQKYDLDVLLEGAGEYSAPLAALPPDVDLKKFRPVTRKFKAPEGWYLRHTGKKLETNLHLLPEERDALLRMVEPQPQSEEEVAMAEDPRVPKPELNDAAKKFQEAVNRLHKAASQLGLKERLQVLLQEDPDRVGPIGQNEAVKSHERPGDRHIYESLLNRYDEELRKAKQTFDQDHLANVWGKVLAKKAEVVGPVDALSAEFRADAYKLLDAEQVTRGPVPDAPSRIGQINRMTIWSLILLGGALILGFFSRFAALGAAGLLLLFYLPIPPWPGVPEAPGPEHSLFVNKNLIECIACLALASLPTGRWIGLDALLRRFVFFRKTD